MNNTNSAPKADATPQGLRKALEAVKRTAQAHIDAVKQAEAALSSALTQLAQDQHALKQEREAFERDLEEFRQPGVLHGVAEGRGEGEEFEEVNEMVDEDGQQMQQDGVEDPAPEPWQTIGSRWRLDGEDQPVEEVDDAAAGHDEVRDQRRKGSGKGRADRSRSRDRDRGGRKAGGGSVGKQLDQAIDRLRLDENATRAIKSFPPEQALDLLNQVGDSVRNPSAFVTKMCNRTVQDGHQRPPSEFERLEAAIADMGLDESATRVLRELSPDQALNLLSQVDNGVRNPSAFVMSLANRVLKSGGPPSHGHSLPDMLEQHVQRLRLDDSAIRMLRDIAPEHAVDILEGIGDDVRNPSALVTAEVRKASHGGGGGGPPRGYDQGQHRGYDQGSQRGYDQGSQRGYDQGPPRGGYDQGNQGSRQPTPRDLSQQVAGLAKALDLDQDCLDALLSISTQEAVMILERLTTTASNIRNRSAFVFAEVKKRKQAASAQAPPQPPRHGPVKTVPCKFYAEGRCKNGPDCRFSHDI